MTTGSPTGPLLLYDQALLPLLRKSYPSLEEAGLIAVLLEAAYVPDLSTHSRFADIRADEIAAADYRRQVVTGGQLTASGGVVCFTSDPISWGNPVTLPPLRYMAILYGGPGLLTDDSPLLALMDLGPAGGAVEAVRGDFTLTPPNTGWFSLTRAA